MRFFQRRNITNPGGAPYITRWTLFECKWFGIMVHRIHSIDWALNLHDHPWPFFAIVLRGGYDEIVERDDGKKDSRVRWFNWKRSTTLHRIIKLRREPTWTLIFNGPRSRNWGFDSPRDGGWIPYQSYLDKYWRK